MTIGLLGSLASVAGLAVSTVGFAFTLRNIKKSRLAAESAESAAKGMREDLGRFDVVEQLVTGISILEEIRRHTRNKAWNLLLDRYSALRRTLIDVRERGALLPSQKTEVQDTLTLGRDIEKAIESGLVKGTNDQHVARWNNALAPRIEGLQTVLAELRAKVGEDEFRQAASAD